MNRFDQGSLSGTITVFLAITFWQISALNGGYYSFLLIFSVIGALVLGLIPGGIGGRIAERFFPKYKFSSYVGGIIIGLIESPFLSIFGDCGLMGGC